MKILSIETSCDDTAITILEAKGNTHNTSFKILANISNSQIPIHTAYGGVFPALAKREHIKNLPILLKQVLRKSKLPEMLENSAIAEKFNNKKNRINLITVTSGPGLEPALWTGITFAKELGKLWKVPVMPVNHMEGHIVSPFARHKGSFKIPKNLKFPIISLLVSGGHTELVLMKKWMQYEIIGETLDDAVGEAYDKVARMLGLEYPGGPKISKLAEEERKKSSTDAFVQVLGSLGPLPQPDHSQKHTVSDFKFSKTGVKEKQSLRGVSQADGPRGSAVRARTDSDPKKISFSFALPRPMIYSKNLNFSFSGLKTAVLYLIKKIGKLDEETKRKIALEFENAVVSVLIHKTKKARELYKAKTIMIGGGVACNLHLQRELKKTFKKNIKLMLPEKELTGDNSIMIGVAGYLNYIKNKKRVQKLDSIKADGNLRFE